MWILHKSSCFRHHVASKNSQPRILARWTGWDPVHMNTKLITQWIKSFIKLNNYAFHRFQAQARIKVVRLINTSWAPSIDAFCDALQVPEGKNSCKDGVFALAINIRPNTRVSMLHAQAKAGTYRSSLSSNITFSKRVWTRTTGDPHPFANLHPRTISRNAIEASPSFISSGCNHHWDPQAQLNKLSTKRSKPWYIHEHMIRSFKF